MTTHRFREHLRVFGPASPVASLVGGFVSCPMFAGMGAAQQAMVREVYRLAAERTREQLRPKPRRVYAFSVN